MKSLHNIRFMHMKLPKPLGIKLLAAICVVSLFASLFGCSKKPECSFDKEKTYYFSCQGVIAGGGFCLGFNPKGIVDYDSYVHKVPENEADMTDKGADIFRWN